jgi:ribosomal protein S18 acetylase RimI-like enzyme
MQDALSSTTPPPGRSSGSAALSNTASESFPKASGSIRMSETAATAGRGAAEVLLRSKCGRYEYQCFMDATLGDAMDHQLRQHLVDMVRKGLPNGLLTQASDTLLQRLSIASTQLLIARGATESVLGFAAYGHESADGHVVTYLYELHVHPAYHRCRLGTKLFNAVVDAATLSTGGHP